MAGHPINPYGETKLIGEWMMADCERAWDLKWIGLRYFNVAGVGNLRGAFLGSVTSETSVLNFPPRYSLSHP